MFRSLALCTFHNTALLPFSLHHCFLPFLDPLTPSVESNITGAVEIKGHEFNFWNTNSCISLYDFRKFGSGSPTPHISNKPPLTNNPTGGRFKTFEFSNPETLTN
jgi:hypothetical protein